MKEDFKVHATERSNGGEQIEIAPHSDGATFTSRVQLFVPIPTAFFGSVPCKEYLDVHQLSLLPCFIAWRVLWDCERHANTDSIAGCEGCREVYAAPSIIHVSIVILEPVVTHTAVHLLPAIITMHTKTATLPAWKPERRIRRRNETNCNTCVCLLERVTAAADSCHS